MVGLVARVRIVGVLRSYFIFVLAKIRKSGLINVRWFLRVFIIENSSIVVLSFLRKLRFGNNFFFPLILSYCKITE